MPCALLWVAIVAQSRRQDSLAGMSAVELAQAIWLLLITDEARAAWAPTLRWSTRPSPPGSPADSRWVR
jgi:hypothetical protein